MYQRFSSLRTTSVASRVLTRLLHSSLSSRRMATQIRQSILVPLRLHTWQATTSSFHSVTSTTPQRGHYSRQPSRLATVCLQRATTLTELTFLRSLRQLVTL